MIDDQRATLAERLDDTPSLRDRGVTSVRDLERLLGPEPEQDAQALLDAASLLGFVGDADSVAPLRRLLASSEDPEVRQVAGLSLGLIGGLDAVRALSDALRVESDSWTRGRLVDALAYPALDEASELLRAVLSDPAEAPHVRGVAAESLGRLAPPGVLDDLLRALAQAEPEIRFFAAHALGMLGSRDALDALAEVARSDDASIDGFGSVAAEAREAIEAITGADASRQRST